MSIIEEINNFTNTNEKFSYTIITYSYSCEELIELLKKKLENINKKIKDHFKKKLINDRIFSLITNLEAGNSNEIINSIFLVNSKINKFNMSKEDLKFCSKWNILKLYLDYDDKFDIEYVRKLFSIKDIKTVFKFSKSNYTIIDIDSVKSRTVENHSQIEEEAIKKYISTFKPVMLYGQNQILKKLEYLEKDNILINSKNLTNEEVLEIIENKTIMENQELFKKEFLDNINNPSQMDKLLFGRTEVVDAINSYMVKKLFVNPKIYALLIDNLESSVLNFEIFIVKPNQPGDYGQTLNKDYGGIVAIKYY